jgi:hypothetical protein
MAGRIAYLGNIVTQGLVLDLDAAIKGSYPGTGTTWTDVSNNGNNGTLINGPTFSSADYGSIVFDGTNDVVNCGNSTNITSITNQVTFGGFVRFTAFGTYRRFIFKDNGIQGVIELFYNVASNRFSIEIVTSGGRTTCSSTTIPVLNQIYNLIGTYDGSNIKIYVNSVLETTVSKTGNIDQGSPSGALFLGNTSGFSNPSDFYLAGNIYNVQIYNRALSQAEITQNFNALRGRYGI